jgi:hypothetical protein
LGIILFIFIADFLIYPNVHKLLPSMTIDLRDRTSPLNLITCGGLSSDLSYMRQVTFRLGLFFLIFGVAAARGTENQTLHSGRVVAATVSGHGPAEKSSTKHFTGRDIWWNYCIASGDQFYSVVSRENPEKIGVASNPKIQFAEEKKWIYIKSKGKSFALRIMNKGRDQRCP